ncbi:fungal-specific transcription factor domain-containing protein [Aspergillus californicus]
MSLSAMGRKKTACLPCASIKSACDRSIPCSRCARLQIWCNYLRPNATDHQGASSLSSRKRIEHTRSSNGCLTCKHRRKKCDERQPTCRDCERLNVPCKWAPHVGMVRRSERNQDNKGFLENLRSHVTDRSLADITAGIKRGILMEWMALLEDEGGSDAAENLAKSNALVLPPGDSPLRASPSLLGDHLNGERHIYNHFLHVFSRALVVVKDDENPFLRFLVPMAFTHASIRHAIIALSASHLAKAYPEFQLDALKHQSRALRGLKVALGQEECSSDCALATTLILCLLEICQGSSKRWLCHLQGARAIVTNLALNLARSETTRFLCRLFQFIDSTASITLGTSRLLLPFDSADESIIEVAPTINPLYGLAQSCYGFLDRINTLVNDRSSILAERGLSAWTHAIAEIEVQLKQRNPLKENMDVDHQEAIAAAGALQWATLLFLYQKTEGSNASPPKLQEAIDMIISTISMIKPGSKMESRLLFPLFMAGVSSTQKGDRLNIEYRLSVMERTIGFGNIFTAHKLLDMVWPRKNSGDTGVDWLLIVREEVPWMILF